MDDLLKPAPTTDEAVTLAYQLMELLKKGGSRVTKWLSNSRKVIQALPPSQNLPIQLLLISHLTNCL